MNTAIDHRLLRVFCAVVETQSVSHAASLLGIAQPSASYLLGQLRARLADPLFVKSDGVMKPTPKALSLYREIRKGLDILDAAFNPAVFEPGRSDRNFRLAISDIGELAFLPPILSAVAAAAPLVSVKAMQVRLDELARSMDIGEVDFAIGSLPELLSGTAHRSLFHEHYIGLLRAEHPLVGRRLTPRTIETLDHIVVTSPFAGHHVVERRLREAGLLRKPRVSVQSFASVPELVATTDFLAIAPSRLAETYAKSHGLRALALPVSMPPIEVRMHWSARHQDSAAHIWMRDLLFAALSRL